MKRTIICIIALSCILPCRLNSQVYQNTPVTVSEDVVTRNGVKYHIHNVLNHQTLFSICRTYGVTLQEVLDSNKDLDLKNKGLKTGQQLLIPEKESDVAQTNVTTGSAPAANHEPQVSTQINQDEDYEEYIAKWYEDLSMIAAKFNISKYVLLEYNGMKSEEISRKQKIRIPKHPGAVSVSLAKDETVPANVNVAAAETKPSENTMEEQPSTTTEEEYESISLKDARTRFKELFKKKTESIRVGVALPFNAKGQINNSAYDLYSGMLIALRDLSTQGIKSSVSVRDTRNQANQINESWLNGCDIIIGPIAPDEIRRILDNCGKDTPVISPLDPKAISLAEQYSNFIQAPSNVDAQISDIVGWIKEEKGTEDRIILITEKGAATTAMQRQLEESGLQYSTVTYGILESENAVDRIEKLMSDNGTNRAVIASDNEAFVNDAVRNLNVMTYKKYNVVLYAPSKIRSFETVEVEGLHNVHAHISSSYFVDYDSERVKNFLLTYRAIFGTEPTPFAYQGYDAAYYFIRNFATPEREYERMDRMEGRKYRGLQSDFQLDSEDPGNSGYVNKGIRRVIYSPDFSIKLVD